MLLDALHYHAAVNGRPLPLELATALEEFPDFHSGYKLFDRATAADVFLRPPRLCGVTEDCYYRHGVEAVMTVESLLAGARLTVVNRSTLNEQPVTTFGLMKRQQLVADKMIWAFRRLAVPPPFVRQFVDNHLPRLLLATLVPDGQRELAEIRRLVFTACGVDAAHLEKESLRPLFL